MEVEGILSTELELDGKEVPRYFQMSQMLIDILMLICYASSLGIERISSTEVETSRNESPMSKV
jgi:hypothetical protein